MYKRVYANNAQRKALQYKEWWQGQKTSQEPWVRLTQCSLKKKKEEKEERKKKNRVRIDTIFKVQLN